MTRVNVLDELGPDGRRRVLRDLLNRLGIELPISPKNGTTYAVACPWHDDNGPSLVVAERAGFVECRGVCRRRLLLLDLAVVAGFADTKADAAERVRREYVGAQYRAATSSNGNGHAEHPVARDFAAWHARTREGLDWTKLPPDDSRLVLALAASYSPRSLEDLDVGFAPARTKDGRDDPPALVFAVRDVEGVIVAVKLRALRAVADGPKSRSVGPTGSGILGREQLGEKSSALGVVAAGEKDMAHGVAAVPEFAWTSCGSGEGSTLGPLVALYAGRPVVVLYDKDAKGYEGAEKLGRELLGVAASVAIAEVPDDVLAGTKDEKDVADVCRKFGPAAGDVLRGIIAGAKPLTRPKVVVRSELSAVTDEAERALVGDPRSGLYSRSGLLVRVVRGGSKKRRGLARPAGAAVIEPASPAFVRERLDVAAEFVSLKTTEKGTEERAALPPSWVVETLLARGSWALPELAGIIEAPTMRGDGSILAAPGYDAASGLLFEPAESFPSIPDAPTADDVRAAIAVLREPLLDFPFLAESDRAAAVAMMLTTTARYAIDGPAPLFPVRANSPGIGKTLLVDVASIVATGREAARMTIGRNDEETRKLILAIGLEGAPVVLLDNIEGALGSASLAAALTSMRVRDRLLGFSKLVTVSLAGTTWFATGNGLVFRGDVGRRAAPVDLESDVETPEDRTGFKHADLLAFVRASRARLVVAALTILRAFHVAGRPSHNRPRFGSFEAWDDLIRGACIWAGLGDPLAGRQRIREEGDADLDALRGALSAWKDVFGPTAETAAGAVREATRARHDSDDATYTAQRGELRAALAALAGVAEEKLTAKSVGYALRRVRRRPAGGLMFEREPGETRGSARWRVAGSGGDGGHGGDGSRPSAPPASGENP